MGDRALINQSYGGRQSLLDGEAIMGAMGGAQSGGTPTPTPAPTFATQPQVTPASGTAGTTTFTATPGTVSNGTISSRAWLLNGSSISSGTTAAPASAGTLTYQEFANGPGGSASSAIQSVTVAAAAGGGTSAERYSVMGTGMRWPAVSATSATNTFFYVEFFFGTPDYPVTDPRVFCPSFWSPTSPGEVYIDSGTTITIQGWAIETSTGVYTACDGAAEAGVGTVTSASAGLWLPRVAATLNANQQYRARLAFTTNAVSVAIPRVAEVGGANAPGGFERSQGATTTFFGRLSTGASPNNSGGVMYKPAMMVAKGGDGRPAVIAFGDSIGNGSADSSQSSQWGPRNTFGYIERGLDSNSGVKRLGYHIMCLKGQAPAGNTGLNNWDNPANWAGKRAALQAVRSWQSDWPFDRILSQHITNAVPYSVSADGNDLRVGMSRYYDLLNTTYGKPITQVEGLAATLSTDGFATLANQTPQGGYTYPTASPSAIFYFNTDVGGVDGLSGSSAYYRTNAKIADSIPAWRYVSADTANDRDLYPVRPFSTTLASAYVSGTTVVLTDAPAVNEMVNMLQDSGTYGPPRVVASVTGTGPYTVVLDASPGTAAAAGKNIRAVWGDGIHPAPPLHTLLVQSLVDWKIARGWTA